MTEDEMAGWHHQLHAHESGWTLGVGDAGEHREAWRAAIHGVAKSRTWLSDWTELYTYSILGVTYMQLNKIQEMKVYKIRRNKTKYMNRWDTVSASIIADLYRFQIFVLTVLRQHVNSELVRLTKCFHSSQTQWLKIFKIIFTVEKKTDEKLL